MKKIFTLIFSFGLLTSVFAQSGDSHQRQNQYNSYQQSAQYSKAEHNGRYSNGSDVYSNSRDRQWNNNDKRNQQGQYGYKRNDENRNYANRDEYFNPEYTTERGGHNYGENNYKPLRVVPILQIIFRAGRR